MKPGFFVGILIMLFFIGEFFFKNKRTTTKEVIIIIIAAIAAGAFAGFAVEWGLSLFRTFMQANIGEARVNKNLAVVASAAKRSYIL